MREGWTYKKLGEVCEILNGFAFKSEKYIGQGIRVLRITNVQKGVIVDNDPKYYPVNEEPNIKQYMLQEDDLLMSLTGNVGRVGLLQRELLPAALNQRVACLRIKYNDVLLKYLFHLLNSDHFEKDCIYNAAGIAQKNMSTEWLKKYAIPVPPIEEQERIVFELDLLSGIIEKKKEQLKEYDKLAQSIFYDMFGDILEANPTMKLKDVASYFIGLTYKPSDVSERGTIVLRSSNIQNNVLDFNDTVRVNLNVSDNKTVKEGDILMCARNGSARLVGKVARITNLEEKMSFGAFMTIIRSKYNEYLFHFFLSDFFRAQLTTSKTATINQITSKMLDNISINVPPLSLQQSFAEKVEAIEKQKALVQQSISETQTLFDSTMDKYFG